MQGSRYPLLVAAVVGCAGGLAALLLADCTFAEAAWRAAVGMSAGWLLARLAQTALQQLSRTRRAAAPPIDLAENPLTEEMVAEAKHEAMGSTVAAQDAAQIVSRMMKQPARDK